MTIQTVLSRFSRQFVEQENAETASIVPKNVTIIDGFVVPVTHAYVAITMFAFGWCTACISPCVDCGFLVCNGKDLLAAFRVFFLLLINEHTLSRCVCLQ